MQKAGNDVNIKAMEKQVKKYPLIHIYWYLIAVFGVLSVINTMTTENYTLGTTLNAVFFAAGAICFFLGYIDYRNYRPLTAKQEKLYVLTGGLSLAASLFYINIYAAVNTMYMAGVSRSTIWLNVLVALVVGVETEFLLFSFIRRYERKRALFYFLAAAFCAVALNIALTAWVFDTVLGVGGEFSVVTNAFPVDHGQSLSLIVIFYSAAVTLLYFGKKERHGNLSKKNKKVYSITAAATLSLLVAVTFGYLLLDSYSLDDENLLKAYTICETVFTAFTAAGAVAVLIMCEKGTAYGQIMKKWAIVTLIFTGTAVLSDAATTVIASSAELTQTVYIILYCLESAFKTAAMLAITLYIILDKKAESASAEMLSETQKIRKSKREASKKKRAEQDAKR